MGLLKSKPALSREEALAALPTRLPSMSEAPIDEGTGLRVTVKVAPARWQRWLGSGGQVKRSFDLDALGVEIYRACDGHTNVRDIVAKFGKRHGLGKPEAEISVTQFLNTLMSRGLIAMEVE